MSNEYVGYLEGFCYLVGEPTRDCERRNKIRKKEYNSLSTRAGFNWAREFGMMCKCSALAAWWCCFLFHECSFLYKKIMNLLLFCSDERHFHCVWVLEIVKQWLSLLRMCFFVFYLVERRSYRDGAKNKTKSTTCWRSSSMHPRTYSQICIRIFYLASRRLYQVSNALKRTEINAQGDLLCGVSFLVAGRLSGSSVADFRYRIGVDIFSGGLYGANNGQA